MLARPAFVVERAGIPLPKGSRLLRLEANITYHLLWRDAVRRAAPQTDGRQTIMDLPQIGIGSELAKINKTQKLRIFLLNFAAFRTSERVLAMASGIGLKTLEVRECLGAAMHNPNLNLLTGMERMALTTLRICATIDGMNMVPEIRWDHTREARLTPLDYGWNAATWFAFKER